jgi:hypothetical protein
MDACSQDSAAMAAEMSKQAAIMAAELAKRSNGSRQRTSRAPWPNKISAFI